MGLKWSGSATSDANFNSTFAFEARVSTTVSGNSGFTYDSIQDALDAGHRDIYVEAGNYSSENISITGANTRIVGGRGPHLTAGAMVGRVDVDASYVHLENLVSYNSTSEGFRVHADRSFVTFNRCYAYNATNNGWQLCYGSQGTSNHIVLNQCMAWICGNSGLRVLDAGVSSPIELSVTDSTFYGCGARGVSVCSEGTYAATSIRSVKLSGCWIRNNTNYGVGVGPYATLLMQNCDVYNNQGGVYIVNPTNSTARTVLANNFVRYNTTGTTDVGVHLSSATSEVTLIGNVAVGNVTNYINCESCTGWSTNRNN